MLQDGSSLPALHATDERVDVFSGLLLGASLEHAMGQATPFYAVSSS